ncbi:MAG: hypothetical protein EBR01_04110 [Proteobacteria bacterium]|nr:hypothetical protein [Pseudomonadota bacterium]
MEETNKLKSWINEKAPGLAVIYQNKYVGMIYDRLASLPPKKQKQVVFGILGGTVSIALLFLIFSYWSLWSLSSETQDAYSMSNMILQYQKYRRDRAEDLILLSKNSQLSAPGQLKQVLLQTAASAGISPRMIQVEERAEAGVGGTDSKKKEFKIKESTVSAQRITLSQLTSYLKAVEYGNFSLIVSSIKITNDDKLRGYLNVDMTIMAYVFEGDEG